MLCCIIMKFVFSRLNIYYNKTNCELICSKLKSDVLCSYHKIELCNKAIHYNPMTKKYIKYQKEVQNTPKKLRHIF